MVVDFAEGDMIVVIGGVWKDTVGVITAMNYHKQTVTINVELFGRETPVEVSFLINTGAGGVLVMKLKLLSAYTVITTGIIKSP